MQKHYNCFDFFKLLLLLAVIMTHACYSAPWAFWRLVDNHFFDFLKSCSVSSCNAVEGFFIISGFLLVTTFKNTDMKTFVLKKYFRLAPVAIFSILIAIILHSFHLVKLRVVGDILTVFMLNNFGVCWSKCSNPVLWYSSALFAGLILYFAIIKYLPKKKEIITMCLVIASYVLLEVLKNGVYAGPYKNFYGVLNVGFLRALGGLGIGCLIAWIQKNDIKTNYVFNSFFEVVLFCMAIAWLFLPHLQITNFVFVIIITTLLWFFIQNNGVFSNLINRFNYKSFSKYIYSVYVVHYLVGYAICGGIYKSHLQLVINYPIISSLLYLISSVIVGIIAFYIIERPVCNYVTNKISATFKT